MDSPCWVLHWKSSYVWKLNITYLWSQQDIYFWTYFNGNGSDLSGGCSMHIASSAMVMFPRMNNSAVLWRQVLLLDLVLWLSHVFEYFGKEDLLTAFSLNLEKVSKIKSYIPIVAFRCMYLNLFQSSWRHDNHVILGEFICFTAEWEWQFKDCHSLK